MMIEYDDYDLYEVFWQEPLSVTGNPADGEVQYSRADQRGNMLSLLISAYGDYCSLFLEAGGCEVFAGRFHGITAIERQESSLILKEDNQERVIILSKDFFKIRVQTGESQDS